MTKRHCVFGFQILELNLQIEGSWCVSPTYSARTRYRPCIVYIYMYYIYICTIYIYVLYLSIYIYILYIYYIYLYIYSTCRWHGSCRTYPKNANSHVICKVKNAEKCISPMSSAKCLGKKKHMTRDLCHCLGSKRCKTCHVNWLTHCAIHFPHKQRYGCMFVYMHHICMWIFLLRLCISTGKPRAWHEALVQPVASRGPGSLELTDSIEISHHVLYARTCQIIGIVANISLSCASQGFHGFQHVSTARSPAHSFLIGPAQETPIPLAAVQPSPWLRPATRPLRGYPPKQQRRRTSRRNQET